MDGVVRQSALAANGNWQLTHGFGASGGAVVVVVVASAIPKLGVEARLADEQALPILRGYKVLE